MHIKKLLFVTKFEELFFDALKSLLPLRQASLNHVVFVNVIEREKVAMHRGAGYRKDEEIRLRERANIRFIDWAETLFEQGMECGVYIVVGRLVREIIKAAEKEEADLIVVGRRSQRSMLEHLYSGSDVTEIVSRSSVPVLVYKDMSEDISVIEQPFKNLLLAIDWSPASLRAVDILKELEGVVERIDVIHVASEKALSGSSAMAIQKTRKQTRAKLDDICDIFEEHGIRAQPHVYIGDPLEEIEKAARECQASMIVLGSSGKTSWVEKFLGSIPTNIAEKSAYPTLIVPPQRK
jgi:nucleotide-binding universal stress UspA family protein